MAFTGEIAAVGAALCFSATSTLFTIAGRQYGPLITMRATLPIGMTMMLGVHLLLNGTLLPVDVEAWRWLLLGISGIIGFGWNFIVLVNAFLRIGPRLALLVTALSPVFTVILAWALFDEVLEAHSILGIFLTIGGIAWVVSDGSATNDSADDEQDKPKNFRTGVMFALLGAAGQTASFLLSDRAVEGDFDPITGSLIRLMVAAIAVWGFTMLRGQVKHSLITLRSHPGALRRVGVASLTGPVMGASLVLVALQFAPAGIASTLANLTPIFLIPIGYFVFKERITGRAIVGTLIAVCGTALLFL